MKRGPQEGNPQEGPGPRPSHSPLLAPSSFSSRVVSDHCYPFMGSERDEAGPAPRCMMHSRAMGRGKRQATARCPSSHVHANDIYQVTPAYRLGSSVSLYLVEGAEAGRLARGWSLTPDRHSPPHPQPSRRRRS